MISVIIVNFNGVDLIIDCLRALDIQTFHDFEIILVDNGSTDGSLAAIEAYLKTGLRGRRVELVRLSENLGFTGGNIEGLKRASGKYIALLNNDTEPDPVWLAELCKAMDEDPGTGICASKLISSRTGTIDTAGDGYTRDLRGFKRGEGEPPGRFDEKSVVFGACGGAVLYRRAMLDEIGFLDNDFFLMHEDTDLNLRAKLAGWKAVFVPAAAVLHKVTSSIGYMSDVQIYYNLRNAEFVRVKNIPIPVLVKCFPGFALGIISEFLFYGIKHGRTALFFKAKKDAVKGLPRMLAKRKGIMKGRKIDNKALFGDMTPVYNRGILRAKLRRLLHG